jgi:Flp pilus assembly protein CpaB
VLAKTATLELSPHDAEQLERAAPSGTVSLTLRALGDGGTQQTPVASTATSVATPAAAPAATQSGTSDVMTIIGYGVSRSAGGDQGD